VAPHRRNVYIQTSLGKNLLSPKSDPEKEGDREDIPTTQKIENGKGNPDGKGVDGGVQR